MLSSSFVKISIILAIVGGSFARPQSVSVGDGSSETTNSEAVALADEKLKPKIGKQPTDLTGKPPVKAEGLEWGPTGLAGDQPAPPAPEVGKSAENQPIPGGLEGINEPKVSPGTEPKGPPGLNIPGLKAPPAPVPENKQPLGKEAGNWSPPTPAEPAPNGADPSKKGKKPDGPVPPAGDKAAPNSTNGKSERSSASKPLELSKSALTTGLLGVMAGLASIFV